VVHHPLVLGAFRRIAGKPTVREMRRRDAWLMGAGLLILANSRPFEGMILSLLVGTALVVLLVRRRGLSMRAFAVRLAAPVAVMVAVTGVTICYYNLRVTGDPLKLPHILYGEIYDPVPHFFWQPPRALRAYRHASLPNYFIGYQMAVYERQNSFGELPLTVVRKALFLAENYFQHVALALGLLALPFALKRNRWMQFAATVLLLFFFVALVPVTYSQHHFSAPVLGLFFVLEMQALRHLRLWRMRGKRSGRFIVRAILVLCLAALALKAARLTRLDEENPAAYQRAQIVRDLSRGEDRHLIVVRYSPQHDGHFEWVYNAADIDGAKVVWAREMDAAGNRKLLEYFKPRRLWLLEAEAKPPALIPYPIGENP